MHVLIVTRRGVTIGVFTAQNDIALRQRAERINGAVLTWQNYVSHIGAHASRDEEMSFSIHTAQEA